jgi:FkbM family methyltransferase
MPFASPARTIIIAEQMNTAIKSHLLRMVRHLGLGVTSRRRLEELIATERDVEELFGLIETSVVGRRRNSQLGQDLFVLLTTGFKRNGYFVEFGATNGVDLSNTFLLETHYGWQGILAEPAPVWHDALLSNRKASIDFDCVWNRTGEHLRFAVTSEAELSTISSFSRSDQHSMARRNGQYIMVNTVSLNDLLHRHDAPDHIDYLSIDTEGSEYDILSELDFDRYSFSVITCEHNYTDQRDKIYELLVSRGYSRTLQGISKFDDWYVRKGSELF